MTLTLVDPILLIYKDILLANIFLLFILFWGRPSRVLVHQRQFLRLSCNRGAVCTNRIGKGVIVWTCSNQ